MAVRDAVWTTVYVLHNVVIVVHGWDRAHDYVYANYDEGEWDILDWKMLVVCI